MVTDLKTSILYKCPVCGQMQIYNLSIFSFSGNKAIILSCECKHSYITIRVGRHNKYTLSSPCIACNEFHKFEVGAKAFWNSKIICFTCPQLENDLFYAGDMENLNRESADYNDETDLIMNQLGFDNLKEENPFLLKIASHLDTLSKNGALKCSCGCKNIKTQLFFDRVELICTDCLSTNAIDAYLEDDAQRIKEHKKIILTSNKNSQKNI